MLKVMVLTPQREEFVAVKAVLGLAGEALQQEGLCVLPGTLQGPGGVVAEVTVACLDTMYNYPIISHTHRLFSAIQPDYAFLLGSGCGNLDKVKVCDVVVSNELVAYLGRGRYENQTVNPRPITFQVAPPMRTLITGYSLRQTASFAAWNRECLARVRAVCKEGTRPPDLGRRTRFEVKLGIVASDDMVLTWDTEEAARTFWRLFREDARVYDMESAGFSHACEEEAARGKWAVVRGVSDLGLRGQKKYHLAAAVVAATWLRGFVLHIAVNEGAESVAGVGDGLEGYDWRGLFRQLEEEEARNVFVGKRRFIRETLRGSERDVKALMLAVDQGGVREREVPNPKGQGTSTTAIGLDKDAPFWSNAPSFVAPPTKPG